MCILPTCEHNRGAGLLLQSPIKLTHVTTRQISPLYFHGSLTLTTINNYGYNYNLIIPTLPRTRADVLKFLRDVLSFVFRLGERERERERERATLRQVLGAEHRARATECPT